MLRKIIILLSAWLPLICLGQTMQNPSAPAYRGQPIQWKLNLVSPFTGGIGMGLETPVAGRFNVALNAEYGLQQVDMWEGLQGDYSSIKGVLEGRAYPFRPELTGPADYFYGPYTGFWVRYQQTDVQGRLPDGAFELLNGETYASGLMIGWQFNLLKKFPGFLIDLSAGAGYQTASMTGKLNAGSRSIPFVHKGFVPRLTCTMGLSLGGGKGLQPFASATPAKERREKTADVAGTSGKTSRRPPDQKAKAAHPDLQYYERYDAKQIRTIKRTLRQQGFDPGKVNGEVNTELIQAVIRFQKANRLTPDGRAGEKTLRKMGLEGLEN